MQMGFAQYAIVETVLPEAPTAAKAPVEMLRVLAGQQLHEPRHGPFVMTARNQVEVELLG